MTDEMRDSSASADPDKIQSLIGLLTHKDPAFQQQGLGLLRSAEDPALWEAVFMMTLERIAVAATRIEVAIEDPDRGRAGSLDDYLQGQQNNYSDAAGELYAYADEILTASAHREQAKRFLVAEEEAAAAKIQREKEEQKAAESKATKAAAGSLTKEGRKHLKEIRSLLGSPGWEGVLQGVELAYNLDSPALNKALSNGIYIAEKDDFSKGIKAGDVRWKKSSELKRVTAEFRRVAALHLANLGRLLEEVKVFRWPCGDGSPAWKLPLRTGAMAKASSQELREAYLDDLKVFSQMSSVEDLSISGPFSDLQPLAGFTTLKSLSISGPFSDLQPLAGLTTLQNLRLATRKQGVFHTMIADVSPLVRLQDLRSLVVTLKAREPKLLMDISPLVGLKGLQRLELNLSCGGSQKKRTEWEEHARVMLAGLSGCSILIKWVYYP